MKKIPLKASLARHAELVFRPRRTASPLPKGVFIVLDGPDGSGKSTQARLLVEWLRGRGIDAMHLREPGSTSIGEQVRKILLDPANMEMCLKTELFLYMASRAQLVEQVIAPSLRSGKAVVCERFLSASIVYQGFAGGLSVPKVAQIGKFAIGGAEPDLVLILDIAADGGLARIRKGFDRMEKKELLFHEAVRKGFLALAEVNRTKYTVVNAARSVDTVHRDICRRVEAFLKK